MLNHVKIIDELLKLKAIAIIPNISLHLYNASLNKNFDCKDAAFYIKKDPGIASQLLKIANSAYYNRGNEIVSIDHSIAYLGIEVVRKMIYAIECGKRQITKTTGGFDTKKLWKNTLAVALLSHELSIIEGCEFHDAVYLTALIKNIGLLFIINNLPDIFKCIIDKTNSEHVSFSIASEDVCSHEYQFLTYLITEKWDFPWLIKRVFKEKYYPTNDSNVKDICTFIAMSEWVIHDVNYEVWDKYFEPDPVEKFPAYKINQPSMQYRIEKVIELVESIADTFKI